MNERKRCWLCVLWGVDDERRSDLTLREKHSFPSLLLRSTPLQKVWCNCNVFLLVLNGKQGIWSNFLCVWVFCGRFLLAAHSGYSRSSHFSFATSLLSSSIFLCRALLEWHRLQPNSQQRLNRSLSCTRKRKKSRRWGTNCCSSLLIALKRLSLLWRTTPF